MSLCPRTRRWSLRGLAVLVLGVVLVGHSGAAWAAFKRTAASTGSSWSADTLDPATNFAFTRPCTVTTSVPTHVGTGTAVAASGTATVTKPSGTTIGDFLVAFSIVTDDTSDNNANTPAGWTRQIDQYYTGRGSNVRVFTKFAASESSYSFSGFDTSDHGAVVLDVYRGVSTTTPVEEKDSQTNASSTSATAPSVTTTTAKTRLVFGLVGIATTSVGTPSGTTARGSAVAGTDVVAVFDEAGTTAGATGTVSGTFGSAKYSIGVTLALRAAPGPPDPTVTFTWTPTVDTYATGYYATRTGGGSVNASIPGRTTTGYTDSFTTATQAYTYTLASVYGNWRSTTATATVPAC